MYYLTFDGDDKTPVGENLLAASEAFQRAVENNDWCPALVDEDGVVLISFDNSSYDHEDYDVIIGPKVDRDWELGYGGYGYDRIAEEHDFKFGDWRL